MKLVECVPNVSEGRDRTTIDAIAAAVRSCHGVRLLEVDAGASTHRTVFTFVGPVDAVEEAAFRLVERASQLIDMRGHRGAHPRIGATDVCPFIPLGETTMEECVALSLRVGARIGGELGIPVYLYERASRTSLRESLSAIRRGEYEGLETKLQDPLWAPDFGPASFNARSGVTVVGAREFLIAWNVNLNTRDKKLAAIIAQNIRETGRPQRGEDGRILKDGDGRVLSEPGPSQMVKIRATGWYIEEYGRAQVSINLADFRTTSIHAVFTAVEKEAAALGLRVTGSELVGLIPREAILSAGRHYLARQGKSPAAPEPDVVAAAVVSLGLGELAPFDPSQKIIEYRVAPPRPLTAMPVSAFADAVSDASPAPGGGSAAALAGSLAAGLAAMVAALTHGAKGRELSRVEMAEIGKRSHVLKARLLSAVDEDAQAFDALLAAMRQPKSTEEERGRRDTAVEAATLGAIEIPLAVMRDASEALGLIGRAGAGLVSAASDVGVAALLGEAAVAGAGLNVRINLKGLSDKVRAAQIEEAAAAIEVEARKMRDEILAHVRGVIAATSGG